MNRISLLSLGLIAASAVLSVKPAHADIISALSAAPIFDQGLYAYTYDVSLSNGQLDATNGSGSNPTPLQFGTVYDFGSMYRNDRGLVVYSATGLLASSFSFSFDLTSTPTAYTASPTDNPTLANVRFTYNGTLNYVVAGQPTTKGSYTTLPSGSSNLGSFTVYSPLSNFSLSANYDGQTYKGSNDTIQGDVGLVAVPVAVTTAVPEPASLALLGTGLISACVARRRRRRMRVAV